MPKKLTFFHSFYNTKFAMLFIFETSSNYMDSSNKRSLSHFYLWNLRTLRFLWRRPIKIRAARRTRTSLASSGASNQLGQAGYYLSFCRPRRSLSKSWEPLTLKSADRRRWNRYLLDLDSKVAMVYSSLWIHRFDFS